MRAFFCLEIASHLQQELDKITQLLRRVRVKASWVKPENLHITLKFLGEIRSELVPKLEAAGREALRDASMQSAIEWDLDRVGAFPSAERPRVVWAGSSKEPEAPSHLATSLQEKLEPMGFAPERDRFVTHITLARVKEEGPAVRALTQAMLTLKPFRCVARVDGLTLMESQLTPQGSIYRPLFRLPFSS